VTEVQSTLNPQYMNDEEAALAAEFYDAIQKASRETPRSQQAGQFRVGVSDLGFCPERLRRTLDGQVPDDTDVYLAWLGTVIGGGAEQAWKAQHPEALIQQAIEVNLRVDIDGKAFLVTIPGHPDIVQPEGKMIDVKTDYGLSDPERIGPSKQQQFQRHLYGLGSYEAGLFHPDVTLDDVKVGNVWLDRAGIDKYAHVNLEPFNPDVVDEAREWLADVIYHQVSGQEAEKVPPRDMCAVVCGHFARCRGLDTDVVGLIDDPEVVERVAMYREGQLLASQGDRLKQQAKVHLENYDGMVRLDESLFALRHTFVDASVVEEHVRRGYTKIELRPVKGEKP
jgi:hypothetical protein